MNSEAVKINGLAETKAALDQLPVKVEKSILRRGLRAGAKLMLTAARSEAPERTGAIKRNIKIRGGRGGQGRISLNVGVGAKDFQAGKESFYAPFVLYGHHTGKRLKGRYKSSEAYAKASEEAGRKFVPGNNFLLRAYEATRQAAVDAATASWAEQIQNIGQGAK